MAEAKVNAVFLKVMYDTDTFKKALYKDLKTGKNFIACGKSLPLTQQLVVVLNGEWKLYKGKENLNVYSYTICDPKSPDAIEKYLKKLKIEELNIVTIRKIVDNFGKDTIDVLKNHPLDMMRLGYSEEKCLTISKKYREKHIMESWMELLAKYQLGETRLDAVYKKFGNDVATVAEHPYMLCEVSGITFQTMDHILSFQPNYDRLNEDRLKYGLFDTLLAVEAGGDCFAEPETLLKKYQKRLGIDERSAKAAIGDAIRKKDVIHYGNGIYSYEAYTAESTAVDRMVHLLSEKPDKRSDDVINKAIDKAEKKAGIKLAEKQREAVFNSCKNNVSIITGGPGSGKTTTINVLIMALEELYTQPKIRLMAPTGRASRRMTESTGRSATTIHSQLGLIEDEYVVAPKLLEDDVYIVDEFSMVDVFLAAMLFSSIKAGTKFIMVGDVAQLPSVRCGNVFSDLIQSKIVPTTVLNVTFRQAEGSSIVTNSKAINGESGSGIKLDNHFYFIKANGEELFAKLSSAIEFFRKQFADEEMVVLNPFRKTDYGSKAFNARLQDIFNPKDPSKKELLYYKTLWREGDRVIQLKNDSSRNVFNGDIGYITDVRTVSSVEGKKGVEVTFETGVTEWYTDTNFSEIEHAWCTTIHKSQGSEYPCVLVLFSDDYGDFRQRKLLYTAVTRAKDVCCIVGTQESISYAARGKSPYDNKLRNSYYAARLIRKKEELERKGSTKIVSITEAIKKKSNNKDIDGQLKLSV